MSSTPSAVTIPSNVVQTLDRALKTAAAVASVLGISSSAGAAHVPGDWLGIWTAASAAGAAVVHLAHLAWQARKSAKLASLEKWAESRIADAVAHSAK